MDYFYEILLFAFLISFIAVLLQSIHPVAESIKKFAYSRRSERNERQIKNWLHQKCQDYPEILGIYYFPVGCEGGYLPDDGICIQFEPETSQTDRYRFTKMIQDKFRRLNKKISLWTETDKENIEEELSTMRIDVYVRSQNQ